MYLEQETVQTGRKLTRRDFVLGLIEEALNAAERQTGVGPCEDTAPQDGSPPLENDETAAGSEEKAV